MISASRPIALNRVAMSAALLLFMCLGCRMGQSRFRDGLPPMTEAETRLAGELKRDLEMLSIDIGERNAIKYDRLVLAAQWIESVLKKAGYQPRRQEYRILSDRPFWNIDVEIRGSQRPDEIVIIGAHYDTVHNCPGANDNGTGVVATLALARAFSGKSLARTLRFVLFVNEEPPYFQTDNMGSLVYARACRQQNEDIVAMLSLETMGYFNDEKGSQDYPFPLSLLYPSTGNFIAFVADSGSKVLVNQVAEVFGRDASIPCEKGAAPSSIQGVGWSDHWSFWQAGYKAIMVTDTAPYRYPHYHTPQDTADKVDYGRLARVVAGLERVVDGLSR